MVGSIQSLENEINTINLNSIINSLFGFLIALTFNDIKDTIIENFIIKLINANVNERKTKIKIWNADIDLLLILDMFVRIFLIVLFLFIAYRFSNKKIIK
jgi:hypothetical protein|tara:strand:- start:60 stop:359 length:300 start_codon:yes stop_codon:yes gene_type:complete